MNTSERILQLEKELTELRAQENREKEEARKKASEDKDKELTAIKNAVTTFNEKHGDDLRVVRYDMRVLHDGLFGNYIERNYIEV
jgi:vacuolar-type H+-ATPase subunit E/Vma4